MKFLATIIFSLSLFLSHSVKAQQFNRPVPQGLFQYEYSDLGFNGTGYFLAGFFKFQVLPSNPNYINPYPIIFDSKGYVAWYSQPNIGNCTDLKYYPQTDEYSYTAFSQGGLSFFILDQNLNYIDTINTIGVEEDSHDIQLAENGNWLVSTRPFDTLDLSAYTFDGIQGSVSTVLRGYGIQEINPNGTLVFEWNSNDYFSASETIDFFGYNASNFDYCHGNAIDEDDDGNLLISMRHLNCVYKVDRTTGDVIWRLGGNLSSFTFTNDPGFTAQHDIRILENGNYSVFDNSNMGVPQKTRGVEYALDTVNWTATRMDEFIHPLDEYHQAMGNFSETFEGDRIAGYGISRRPAATATVFNLNHDVLSEFYCADSVMSYRFHYSELPTFVQPEISCVATQNGFDLIAPSAASYEWSTGETTQTISATSLGTYQVWIPHGDGFIGSIPFTVTDLLDPCGILSIDEIDAVSETGPFQFYDLLGRKVVTPLPNQVYIKVWETGATKKVIVSFE